MTKMHKSTTKLPQKFIQYKCELHFYFHLELNRLIDATTTTQRDGSVIVLASSTELYRSVILQIHNVNIDS